MAAYISFLICKESSHLPEIIGWFSDRDSMTTSYKEIIIDLFHINFHTICNHYNIDDSSIEIAYGKAGFGENNLWYDEMLRVPDYISGALAGRNYISESIDKYDDIFEKAISDNSFLSVINLYSENNLKGARRVTFTVNKPT